MVTKRYVDLINSLKTNSKTKMKKLLLFLLLCSLSFVGYSQSYCTPSFGSPYYSCLYYGNSITSLYLNGAASTSISDGTGCSGSGYVDNSGSMSATLYLGNTYNVTVGYGGGTNEVQAWIDYNNDGTFDASETIFSYSYMYYTSYTYSFAVPSGVGTGTRRMRVLVTGSYYGYYAGSLDACASGYYYGDSRDYSVNIQAPPPTVTSTPASVDFGYVTSGSSAIRSVSLSGAYLSSSSSPITVTAPSNYLVCSTSGGTYVTSYTISYSGTSFSATNCYIQFNAPSTAGTYTGSLSITGGGISGANYVPLSGTSASACSGTITAGSISASPSSGLSPLSYTLSLSGATAASGLTYQWASSTSATGTFTNISGATNYTYSVSSASSTLYYKCTVTCTASSSTNTTAARSVPIYCTPNFYYGVSGVAGINSLSINGSSSTSISDAASSTSSYYDRSSLSVTLAAGTNYTATLAPYSTNTHSCSFWIDFDDNGTFASTELVGGRAAFTTTTNVTLTIPVTATQGTHRMRVLAFYGGYGTTYPSTSSCPTASYPYYYGQVRDYTVTIDPPTPVLTASPTTIGFGGVTSGSSSSPSVFVLTGSYLSPSSGNFTVTAPSMFEVSTTGTSGWASSLSVSYSGAAYSGSIYVRFSPTSTGTRSGSVSITGGGVPTTTYVAVSGFGASGTCSGAPSIGTASASPTTANPTTPITLSLPSLTPTGGYTYQWRQSSSGTAGTFTNISGATNVTYGFTGISATTYYKCVVTCTSSGGYDSSGNATVTFTLPSTTCTPSASSSSRCTIGGMASVNVTGGAGSISDGTCSSVTSTGYSDRTSAFSLTLYRSLSYTMTVTGVSSSYSKSTQVWIDFNSNGTFESTESVGGSSSSWTSSSNFSVTIPSGSAVGTFRMRVLTTYSSYGTYPSIDPCLASYYLDGRDYTVTITNSPPVITSSPTSLSFGSVPAGSTSSAVSTSVVGSFLVPSSGSVTITAPTNYSVCATSGGTYSNSITISYSGSGFTSTPVYVKFYAPSTTATYSGTVTVAGGGGSLNIPVTGISANICTGTPTAGTASITPTSGTTTTSFSLSLSGYSTSSGISFQWQSATSSGGTYTNISGATNSTYTIGTLSASRWYKCVVTCSGYGSATSNVVSALIYCTPTFYYTGTVSNIGSLTINGSTGSISDASSSSAWYVDRTSLSCTLTAGVTYVATVSPTSSNTQLLFGWIDFNDDGTFASSEQVATSSSFTSTANISFIIPTTANTGSHRMRCIIWYSGYGGTSVPSCPTGSYPYYYGQARDYMVTIAPPPPALSASPTSISFGGVLVGDSSAVSSTAITGSYLTPTSGNLTITTPNYFKVSPNGTTWYSTSYTQSYTGATVSSVPVYVRFFPPSSGPFSGSVTITGGGYSSTVNVVVSGNGSSACSGTPTAGTASASPTSGSGTTTFNLSLSSTSSAPAGLTYQWQSSSTGSAGSFTNVSGATNAAYSFSGLTATTYYRCKVTCTASGITDSSTNATVTFTLPTASCNPTFGYSSPYGAFTLFNLVGESSSISDASSSTYGYVDRTSTYSCTLYKNNSYNITMNAYYSGYNANAQVWIDFNSDGTFQTTETVGGRSTWSTSTTFSISIPATVPSGTYRLRVLNNYYYNAYPSLNPCGGTTSTSYYYGDARDYKVFIVNPPPVMSASPVSLDFSNVTPSSTSTALSSTVNGLFLVPSSGNLTVTAPSNYSVCATSGGTYTNSITIAYTGGTVSSVPVYVKFYAPATTGTYTGSLTISGGGATTVNVSVTGNSANPCSGTPTAGTAAITPTTGSASSTSFALSITGTSVGTGITYQWYSATSSGGTYSAISGATNSTYTIGTITATTYYKCLVTCTVSSSSAYSNVVSGVVYCTPSTSYSPCSYYYYAGMTGFRLVGSTGTINDASGCASTGYSDRTSLSCTLTAGNSYSSSVITSAYNGTSTQTWIDFNDNGTFESTETVGGSASFTYTGVVTLTIPVTSNTGTHRMRVETNYTGYGASYNYPNSSSCWTGATTPYYYDYRDFTVIIAPPPPAVTATPGTIAFGGVLVSSSSAPQSFNLAGSYLTPTSGNFTITAPSSFQVSTSSSSGWSSSISVSYTGATYSSTPIYVRFNPTAATSYSGS
ncbi:MAG: hypothetical protein EBZ77_01090, partial [Chitinophagia bacterium]|nr:hypothetical protein [Chitinophagia bacterium]